MGKLRRRSYVFLLSVVAALVAAASVSWACAALATLTLESERVEAGQQAPVQGTGKGFNGRHHLDPGERLPVQIRFDTRTGPVLWEGTPTEEGTFAFSFEVPDAPPGKYVLIAVQYRSDTGFPAVGTPARQSLEIVGKRTTSAVGPSPAGGLRSSEEEVASTAPARRPSSLLPAQLGSALAGAPRSERILVALSLLVLVATAVALRARRLRQGDHRARAAFAGPQPSTLPGTPRRRSVVVVALAAMVTGMLPAAVGASTGSSLIRVSENKRVGADSEPARGKDVPGIAINPNDPRHLVEVEEDLLDGRCEYNVSFDGGATWSGGALTAPEGFEGPAPCARFDSGDYAHMDGSVAFGAGQNVYTTYSWNRPGEGDSVLVARSVDGGRTFQTAAVAMSGRPQADPRIEGFVRPRLAVVPRPEGDRIYVTAWGVTASTPLVATDERRIVIARSDDGGQTWSAPVDAQAPTEKAREQSEPVVGPDGTVFVAWRTQIFLGNNLVVARSEDAGATWTRVVVGPVEGMRSTHPKLGVDPNDGTLYVVYHDRPFAPASMETDVLLRRSIDKGLNWSAPLKISDDAPKNGVEQRVPQVSVAPSGRVDVAWHDRRHAYPGRRPTRGQADVFYAFSTDKGQSFSASRRVTDRVLTLDQGLDPRFLTWSFYSPAIASWNGGAVVGWADPREGSYHSETQDVYFATIDLAPTGARPVRNVAGHQSPFFGVPLSKLSYPGAVEGRSQANAPLTRVAVTGQGDAASALAGGVLARDSHGPVLASKAAGLSAGVKEEVGRMRAVGAYLIGDESSLSAQAASDVAGAGVPESEVKRISGASPADTARQIAGLLDTRTNNEKAARAPAFPAAVIVNPATPEAATASAFAASLRYPVLFVERDDIPQPTREALAALAIPKTFVIGGPSAVSELVMAQLPSPKRLGGADLYSTSDAVAAESVALGLPANVVYVADGAKPMDAAGAGAAVARLGGVLMVAPGASPASVEARLVALGFAANVDRLVAIRP